MDSNYISQPRDFQHMEGNSVDFQRTFDLNGTNNDETLRLYLREAGLSDKIECLTPEQRRAFIYDIIKSNKMPGHWMPSTMKTSAFGTVKPSLRPPPPPPNKFNTFTSSTAQMYATHRDEQKSPIIHYATMSSSASSNSLKSMGSGNVSPIVPHRFVPAPQTPPSPSTFCTSARGNKFEISSPTNFQHVSGDMTRDMTRNAFDLSLTTNDNVLKKYMIERGITQEDLSGMQKQNIIRNIVQSKFTWMPPKKQDSVQKSNNIYATIPRQSVPSPPSPQPSVSSISRASGLNRTSGEVNIGSNYTLLTMRFADPSMFPSPNELVDSENSSFRGPPKQLRPAPPPRKTRPSLKSMHAPPIPIQTMPPNNYQENEYEEYSVYHQEDAPKPKETVPSVAIPPPPPPPPPPMAIPIFNQKQDKDIVYGSSKVPNPPPLPNEMNMTKNQVETLASKSAGGPPPPPPPPPMMLPTHSEQVKPAISKPPNSHTDDNGGSGDPRDALLESIRKGVSLKKVNQKSATISGVKPRAETKPPANDFLSELRMGITLRRTKNKVESPHDPIDSEESHA